MEPSAASQPYNRLCSPDRKSHAHANGTLASPSLCNADLTNEAVKQLCQIDHASETLLNNAANKLQLFARSYFKVIKVARTIADLEQQEGRHFAHISEALQYRQRTSIV